MLRLSRARALALVLLALIAAPAVAGTRAEYVAAKKQLAEVYFDELEPDARDRLFAQLCGWDHTETVPVVADVASRYGTYLAGVEGQLAATQQKLAPYQGRGALTDQEVGLRNSYIRKIEKLEMQWRRGRRSEDLLVELIGKWEQPRTVQGALTQYQKNPTWRVRQLLARACAKWHRLLADSRLSKKMFEVLKRLRADTEPGVRVAVARSLSAFRRPEALEMLKLCMRDNDWRVRAAAVKSLTESRSNEGVTIMIEALKGEKGRLKDDIIKALKFLTGQKHEFAESWMAWWVSVGRRLPPPGKRNEVAMGESKAKDTSRFYGIPTRSDRICYIIDVSGSMNKEVKQLRRVVITGRPERKTPVEGKTRIEVARNELKRSVSNLNPDKYFFIIYFNQATKLWREAETKATPPNKKDARKEIEALVASGTTYTLGALRVAFTMAGVINQTGKKKSRGKGEVIGIDTIFLLSDGGPTDNKIEEPKPMDPDLILDTVREWNRDAGIVIHTIAVDTEEVGTYFLKQLAAQNGGVFVERKE